MTQTVGFLVFENVEELDLVGPWEVFGMASRLGADLSLTLIAESLEPVQARYGLRLLPDVTLDTVPELDVLIVPGGLGARLVARHHDGMLDLVRKVHRHGWVVSVCTGALVLAAAGILNGRRATTHASAFDLLRETTEIDVVTDERFVIEESIATSAGVSAGVDLALALLERWYGTELRNRVAYQIEWPSES